MFLTYAPLDMKREYKLDRMRQLMALFGNPQESLRIIHIAGTSGKTSTAYFVRGMLEAAGQRTGLTVSPHIVAINERVQIGGVPLPEAQFLHYANRFFALVAKSDLKPTYFELLIALAYWVFAQEKVDYAVVETGLGGLLDGTNVVARPDKVCVITDIGLDHTEVLGETVQEIAVQKAGIIQRQNVVFVQQQDNTILDIIKKTADRQHADYHVVYDTKMVAGLPPFQRRNWAIAVAAMAFLQARDTLPELTPEQRQAATRQTPSGRFEQFTINGKQVILDGAHNPQKLLALRDALAEIGVTSAAVLANFTEAPTAKIVAALDVLQPITTHLIIPEFHASQDIKGRRSLKPEALAALARQQGILSIEECANVTEALQLLLKRPEDTLLITGSLYLVSAIRIHLQK